MPDTRYGYTPPVNTALRWLTDPGRAASPAIANVLLGELFSTPNAVIAGVINGLVLNGAALLMDRGQIFALFIVVDVFLVAARLAVVRRAATLASRGMPTPTDLYLVTATLWCGLQGGMAFAAMRTNILPLQLLAATTVMGLIGPICARNYAAPRYALMLVCMCDLPFVVGAAVSGEPWLLVLLLQTPLFLFGVMKIIERFQTMAITNLTAEQNNRHQARHDTLTGLLNRFGLMEQLDARQIGFRNRFVLFYLDLDGFKIINDCHGHQAGDKVLRAVGERLRESVRDIDIVSRLGGDEFVIVAPELSPSSVERYADALIQSIAGPPYLLNAIGLLRVGLSIGSARFPEDGESGDDLHRKADAALYEAKAAGRGVHRSFMLVSSKLASETITAPAA